MDTLLLRNQPLPLRSLKWLHTLFGDRVPISEMGLLIRPVLSGSLSHGFMVYELLLSHFSHVRLCATPRTAAYQASPSMGFSRQEYWSGWPVPSPSLFLKVRLKPRRCYLRFAFPYKGEITQHISGIFLEAQCVPPSQVAWW